MPSVRQEIQDEDSGAYSRRCFKKCGIFSLVMSTLIFFGNISMLVYLFEYKYPVKFSVICFMAASGLLYLSSFTTSLLLATKRARRNPRFRTNSSEAPETDFPQQRDDTQAYEMTTNFYYSDNGPNVLQLPPKAVLRKTPPPPYDASGPKIIEQSTTDGKLNRVQMCPVHPDLDGKATNREHLATGCELNRVQMCPVHPRLDGTATNREYLANGCELNRVQMCPVHPDRNGMTSNRVYFDVEEHKLQINNCESEQRRCFTKDGNELETFRGPSSTASSETSPSGSYELKQQRASNSQLFLQVQKESSIGVSYNGFQEGQISLERSPPLPSRAVIRNSSTALKRKLKSGISKSDLNSEATSGNSTINSNSEMSISHSNFYNEGTSEISQSKIEYQSNLSPVTTPRFLRRGEVRSSQINLRPPNIPRTSNSSLNMEKIFPRSNDRKKHDSLSNLNTERQKFVTKTSLLISPERQFRSHSNLNADQQCISVPTETFTSHSNLNDNIKSNSVPSENGHASQSNLDAEPHSNSKMSHSIDNQEFNHSSVSPGSSRSNIVDNNSSQVRDLKKIFQPEQFTVRSNDMTSLHKARSHGSLTVEASKSPPKLRAIGETSGLDDTSIVSGKAYARGRSIESGLDDASLVTRKFCGTGRSTEGPSIDARKDYPTERSIESGFDNASIGARKTSGAGRSIEFGLDDTSIGGRKTSGAGRSIESDSGETAKGKQLQPQEWMVKWDKGINKLRSANGERIVGVRL